MKTTPDKRPLNPKFEPPVRPKQNSLRIPVSKDNSQGAAARSSNGKTEEDGNRRDRRIRHDSNNLELPTESTDAQSDALVPDSDQYAAFLDLLKSSGFTRTQLMLIDDALWETGLQISVVDEGPFRPGNRP
ncbi:MAG: hypothetical protein P8K08_12145 [Fuerstiella sp.]|nr:hypothetical protein [Fuerstiella sp.]